MSALSKKLRLAEGFRLHFWCPGCDEMHSVFISEEKDKGWKWNNDAENPTFTPSILVKGHKLKRDEKGKWIDWERDEKGELIPTVCHSFVTKGKIKFLDDCTHKLKGQTVQLPEWTEVD